VVLFMDPLHDAEIWRDLPEPQVESHPVEQPNDIIEFVVSDRFLDKGHQLYPRQATLLKVIFLEKDLLTDYDYDVLGEWSEGFWLSDPERWLEEHGNSEDDGYRYEGMHGIPPDWETRMDMCIAEGRPWFREPIVIIGRRGSKGYLGGICGARVLWHFMGVPDGNPQAYYGIEPHKRMSMFVFAAKKEQARDNQWRDIYQVIQYAPCFLPYISKPLAESLTLYSPYDLAVIEAGLRPATALDTATFEILPKESTTVSGRGPASFFQAYDEMAHVVKGVAKADAGAVYDQATPSLDTFGVDAFIWPASSPWAMTGKFFEKSQQALEVDPRSGLPVYPEMMMFQLTSWDPYEDWELADSLPMWPASETREVQYFKPIRHPIQQYDRKMKQLQRANPTNFAVERLSHWATVADAYLDPQQVDEAFGPWQGEQLEMQEQGILNVLYIAHGDPSTSGANFGFAIAHTEGPDSDGLLHVVFDLIHAWSPLDFPDGRIDYLQIEKEICEFIDRFIPGEVTFDQFNSAPLIQRLQAYVAGKQYPRRVEIYERTATHKENWIVAETFKTALNMYLIHAPHHDLAEQELKFLQKAGPDRVDHPTMGPIQTKDVADAMMQVTHNLIGDQITAFLERLSVPIRGDQEPGAFGRPGGADPDDEAIRQLQRFSGLYGRGDPTPGSPSRGFNRRRSRGGLR
jgi:hypothetical protein